jgi:Protein of unknown function DUF262
MHSDRLGGLRVPFDFGRSCKDREMPASHSPAPIRSNEAETILSELEDENDESSTSTQEQIEDKYDKGQARIVIQRNDFLVPNLLQMFEKKEVLDMSPTYQRRTRWNDTKRSHLIESLLMNIPIPPIFLYEKDYAQYEVMDGQQRLASIRSFFKNEFKLRHLRVWKELNGMDFRDLPQKIQRGLERRGLAAVIILTESGREPKEAMDIRQYVFERLNTGGERLNAQEIRNCLYASPFNESLIALARSGAFTSIWGIPPKESNEPHKVSRKLERNPLYSKMADCEIVLRYFALNDLAHFKGGMRNTLDDYMIRNQRLNKAKCLKLEEEYLEVLEIASKIYQDGLFCLPKNGLGYGRRSVPLADAVLIAIGAFRQKRKEIESHASKIVEATRHALENPDNYELLVGRGNTKKAIEDRLDLMKGLIAKAARL